VNDPRALLRDLAVPRLTGTAGHAATRERLTRELGARGLQVEVLPFEATAGPARRMAFVAELAALGALVFMLEAVVGEPERGVRLVLIFLAVLAIAVRFGGRAAPRTLGANLLARPRSGQARVWLTAHYDSKSQQVSMAVRLVGLACFAAQLPAAAAMAGWWAAGGRPEWLAVLALPTLVGGIVLSRADLRNDSPGAVDNATGVLAVLATLDRLPAARDIGVCFTDAEEWGLQGARALVRERPELFRDAAVVNFDGLDDRGRTLLFAHRLGPFVARLAEVAGVRPHRWLPALVDGVAFGRVARECVTVMRGDWRTARRVHTPRDEAARLQLDGVRQAAAAVADALAA